MRYEILKTGSKGNCTIVEGKFMLDCGVPYKMVEPYLKDIKMIFISHRHSDHLNKATVRKIAYNYPNIKFLCGVSVNGDIVKCGVPERNVICLFEGKWYSLGLCNVKLDFLYHDVPNFALSLWYNNKTMFYCTDTSQISHVSALGYDLYLIEANYDTDEELDKKILEAKSQGEFTYLERVKHTHLSQLKALNWLNKNMDGHSIYQFIHQHVEAKENKYEWI